MWRTTHQRNKNAKPAPRMTKNVNKNTIELYGSNEMQTIKVC